MKCNIFENQSPPWKHYSFQCLLVTTCSLWPSWKNRHSNKLSSLRRSVPQWPSWKSWHSRKIINKQKYWLSTCIWIPLHINSTYALLESCQKILMQNYISDVLSIWCGKNIVIILSKFQLLTYLSCIIPVTITKGLLDLCAENTNNFCANRMKAKHCCKPFALPNSGVWRPVNLDIIPQMASIESKWNTVFRLTAIMYHIIYSPIVSVWIKFVGHDDAIKWKHFPRYWPFMRELTGHRWIPLTKASDAELLRFFDLRLNKRLSKQSQGWWFQTPSCSSWRHRNGCASVSTTFAPSGVLFRLLSCISLKRDWRQFHQYKLHRQWPANDCLCQGNEEIGFWWIS